MMIGADQMKALALNVSLGNGFREANPLCTGFQHTFERHPESAIRTIDDRSRVLTIGDHEQGPLC
jgi:hypothetical protein